MDVQHRGELGAGDVVLAGALVIPREQELDARLVAGIDVFRLAEFHEPSAQDLLRPLVILRRALGDVCFGSEKQQFDGKLGAVRIEQALVLIVCLLREFRFAESKVKDDLEERRDGAVLGDVRAEAAHFPVSLAEQSPGVRHFLFADGAD